ncbi:MAG: Rrf2 family transcriptional regulator [Firmicutes bacterium]|nr:Rrf2 family transcriptional regulator [Bacillota bacterium]
MMISTRGRYALRVLNYLAANRSEAYIPLKDIVQQQQISQKYLESIMTSLSKAGLVDSVHGKGGGYRLNREPSQYTLGEILRLTESNLTPVACLSPEAKPCDRACECNMLPIWIKLDRLVNDYLDSVTLEDLNGQIKEKEQRRE